MSGEADGIPVSLYAGLPGRFPVVGRGDAKVEVQGSALGCQIQNHHMILKGGEGFSFIVGGAIVIGNVCDSGHQIQTAGIVRYFRRIHFSEIQPETAKQLIAAVTVPGAHQILAESGTFFFLSRQKQFLYLCQCFAVFSLFRKVSAQIVRAACGGASGPEGFFVQGNAFGVVSAEKIAAEKAVADGEGILFPAVISVVGGSVVP